MIYARCNIITENKCELVPLLSLQTYRFLKPAPTGGFTKAQSTCTCLPSISAPFRLSMAACASRKVSNSTNAYPFKYPVRRSKFT